jgi:Ca2+-transporting ATPase
MSAAGRRKISVGSELQGLSDRDVIALVAAEGPNELPQSGHRRLGRIFFDIITEPMVFLLAGCGLIYFILGDRQEALMLLGFLALILCITLYQESKTERALEALRDLSSPRALVLREGQVRRIPGREVVRGDILILNEGDRVSADAEIIRCVNLSVDESMLTGESMPVQKILSGNEVNPSRPKIFVFAGTTVVRGSAIARVTKIGSSTELGKIGRLLREASPEPTRLQVETRSVVKTIAVIAGFLCVAVVFAFAISRQDWLMGILSGLTLAMAILPNELPAVLTVFLAIGAWRLSQKRVLTRRASVIEALGTVTVLCVDKTGTLTQNRMIVRRLCANGNFIDLGSFQGKAIPEVFHEIVEFGILAAERDPFDPMDRAIHDVGRGSLIEPEHLHPDWTLIRQYPLSDRIMALSHAWKSNKIGHHFVAAKGAPEAIADLCHLSSPVREQVARHVSAMAGDGLRVLGVAKAFANREHLPEDQHDFDFEFVGLLGLEDPIRPEVSQAVAECKGAGIRVIMITGDHGVTASSIARQIGLQNPDVVLRGDELASLNEDDLMARVREVGVCARMVPEQKLRLIKALKAQGEIVAMTGDGVNDAPALKNAHIGIAMGMRGTDVARESASLVLLEDDFGSIVSAIKAGRLVYDNLQHAIGYLLAIHIPIAALSIIPAFFDLPVIMMPVHIAFLHLIIEPACSIVFEGVPPTKDLMVRPPRALEQKLFSSDLLRKTIWSGAKVFVAIIVIVFLAFLRGHNQAGLRTSAFTTLMAANIGLIAWRSGGWKNRMVLWMVFVSLGLLTIVLTVPPVRDLFRFSRVNPVDLTVCLVSGVVSSINWKDVKVR